MSDTAAIPTRMRLAVFCDFAEEGWPSMDLAGEMLVECLHAEHAERFDVSKIVPAFRSRMQRLPIIGQSDLARNLDRLRNRMSVYPQLVRAAKDQFDCFHIVDHSYSQLVHELPAARTGVYCHDLDTFRCILDPAKDRRPRWFRKMAGRILDGMQKARFVFHSTGAVREEIVSHGLVDEARLIHAPLGVAPEFFEGVGRANGKFLLHVGSCIPRKRIDLLLDVFAAARKTIDDLRLVKIGGDWTGEQQHQIDRLGIGGAIDHRVRLPRSELAKRYRSATAVIVCSDAEGFGLPVIEALACGAPVIASDIPALREAGGEAAIYCPPGDVVSWTAQVVPLLQGDFTPPARAMRLRHAQQFSWSRHARIIADAYASLHG